MTTIFFPAISGFLPDFDCGGQCGAGRQADRQTFGAGNGLGHIDGFFGRDVNHFVNQCGIVKFGDKTGADAENFMRAGFSAV